MNSVRAWARVAAALAVAATIAGCGNKLEEGIARGDKMKAAGDYDKAELEYRNLLDTKRPNAAVLSRLGILYHDQGHSKAYEYLAEATKLNPEDIPAKVALSRVHATVGQFSQARDKLQEVLEKQPGHKEAMVLFADVVPTNAAPAALAIVDKGAAAAKDSAEYHVARGVLLLKSRDRANAEAELRKAVAANPNYGLGHLKLGALLLDKGATAEAEASLKKAAEVSPLRSPIRLSYAEFRFRQGAVKETLAFLEDQTRKAPDFIPGWLLLARAHAASGDPKAAAAAVEKAVAKDPVNFQALLLQGDLKLAGRAPEAVAHFEQMAAIFARKPAEAGAAKGTAGTNKLAAAGNTNRAPLTARTGEKVIPTELALRLASAYTVSGQTNRAIEALSDYLGHNPSHLQATLIRDSLRIGLSPQETTLAVESLREVLSKHPNLSEARHLMSTALLRQGKAGEALAEARALMARHPKWQAPLLTAGDALMEMTNYAAARPMYERGLEVAPTNHVFSQRLTSLDLLEKKPDSAVARARKLVDSVPTAEMWLLLHSAQRARAQVLGSADPAQGLAELGEAEKSLAKAAELQPTPQLIFALADFQRRCGKPEKGIETLRAAIAKNKSGMLLGGLGMFLESSGDKKAAAEAYEEALKIDPSEQLSLNNLACLYSGPLPNYDRAVELARRVYELSPNSPVAADTLGWAYLRKGDVARALPLLETASESSMLAQHPEVALHHGLALYHYGNEARAWQRLQKALGSTNVFTGKELGAEALKVLAIDPGKVDAKAKDYLQSRVASNPQDGPALFRLAKLMETQGDMPRAAEFYEKAVQALPAGPREAESQLRLATLYSGPLGKPKEALELARAAHATAPDNRAATLLLGKLTFDAGDHRYGAVLLEQGADVANDPAAALALTRAYYSIGRVTDAERVATAAAQSKTAPETSKEARQFLQLVQASGTQSNSMAALNGANAVLDKDPGHLPALMVKAKALEAKNDAQGAAKVYEQALARFPLFAPAARQLAVLCYENLNDPARAATLATKARETMPGDRKLLEILGVAAYRAKDFTRAGQLLQQSDTSEPEVAFYLGMSSFHQRQFPRAKELLTRATSAPTLDTALATEARQALKQMP